jgi:hypothetical protein
LFLNLFFLTPANFRVLVPISPLILSRLLKKGNQTKWTNHLDRIHIHEPYSTHTFGAEKKKQLNAVTFGIRHGLPGWHLKRRLCVLESESLFYLSLAPLPTCFIRFSAPIKGNHAMP